MSNLPATLSGEVIEKLALAGDVSGLSREEKIQYYRALCERVGLDASTQPFKLLKLQGKEVFYCDRGGTQQLSRLHGVSHEVRAREIVNDCYVVTVRASTSGRATESIGAVPISGLKGEALCNAYMKAETKGKRRATLDLLGLGMLDESEISSIPGAKTESIESPVARVPSLTEGVKPAQSVSTHPKTPEPSKSSPKAATGTPAAAKTSDLLPKEPTEATRTWFLEQLVDYESTAVLAYMREINWLLPTETFSDLPLRWVPTSKEALRAWMLKFETWRDGDIAPEPPDEAWRAFPMPYGKNAGTPLEDLEKNYLYGLWANMTVETEYNGKPKKPETIAKDTLFREMLDAAGQHYEFTKKD